MLRVDTLIEESALNFINLNYVMRSLVAEANAGSNPVSNYLSIVCS